MNKQGAVLLPASLDRHRQTFLEALKVRRYSPATLTSRHDSLKEFFRYLAGAGIDDVREVSRQTVRDYQTALLRRFKVATAHVHLSALRRFFEHLEATDVILVNPCAGLALPRLSDRLPRRILTPQEARQLLDAPDPQTPQGIRDKAILETFYSTGIRLEEMARLTVFDVDYRSGFVRVTRGKGARERIVPLGRKACDSVREYLQQARAQWVLAAQAIDERALWLSARHPHSPLKRQMFQVLVKHYARKAGLAKPVSPHVWRHTCATHLVSNGSNIAYVQRLLGHRSLATTQIYTRTTVPELKAAHHQAHPRQADPTPERVAALPGKLPFYRKDK
jgi:integrase/recombinase XerD